MVACAHKSIWYNFQLRLHWADRLHPAAVYVKQRMAHYSRFPGNRRAKTFPKPQEPHMEEKSVFPPKLNDSSATHSASLPNSPQWKATNRCATKTNKQTNENANPLIISHYFCKTFFFFSCERATCGSALCVSHFKMWLDVIDSDREANLAQRARGWWSVRGAYIAPEGRL